MRRLVLGVVVGVVGLVIFLAMRGRGERAASRVGQDSVPAESALVELEAAAMPTGAVSTREERSTIAEGTSGAAAAPLEAAARLVTISGRIVDEQGFAVDGVDVSARGVERSRMPSPEKQTTGADGRFAFAGLVAGKWRLEAESSALAMGDERLVDGSAGDVELELHVVRGHCLVVAARWPDGSPVSPIHIEFPEPDVTNGYDLKAKRGRPAGEYELCRLKGGERTVVVSAERDGLRGHARAKVALPDTALLEVVLIPFELVLRGTALDPEGKPVEGTTVSTNGMRTDPSVEVAADGSFELRGLDPGQDWLQVSAPGHWCEPIPVELGPGVVDVRAVLLPLAQVSGRVVDHEGQPFADAIVVGGFAQGELAGKTDGDGRFQLTAMPGRSLLRAVADGHADSADLELRLAPGERHDGVLFRLRTACVVVGRVVDPDGHPVGGAHASALYSSITTAPDGSFSFDALPPEPLQLEVYHDDAYARATVTPVVGAPTSVELRFEPTDPVHLHARITRAGTPLAAHVYLRSGSFQRWMHLDSAGRLSVTLQHPGRWRGVVTLGGLELGSDDLAAQRMIEFTAPDLESWSLELDWDALSAPLSKAEVERVFFE
jgi:hypothetical protein